MDRVRYIRIFRIAAVANGWTAMITAWGFHRNQILADALGLGPVAGQYLFFTMQANLLAVLWWTIAVLSGRKNAETDAGRMVRGAAALYMLLTGMVYGAVLCRVYAPHGAQAYVNITHHVVTPVLFCVDWMMTEARGNYRWRWVAAWVLYPLGYVVWVMRLGGRTGFYVYPFLDVEYLGAWRVAGNCLGMLVFLALLGMGIVYMNRRFGIREKENLYGKKSRLCEE